MRPASSQDARNPATRARILACRKSPCVTAGWAVRHGSRRRAEDSHVLVTAATRIPGTSDHRRRLVAIHAPRPLAAQGMNSAGLQMQDPQKAGVPSEPPMKRLETATLVLDPLALADYPWVIGLYGDAEG